MKGNKSRLRVLQGELDRAMMVAAAPAGGFGIPVTCVRGCNACCSQQVLATKPEAHAILEAVAEQGGQAVQQLARRCREQLAALGASADDRHAWWAGRTACVLLTPEGLCSVYRERPATCRTYLVVSPPELCRSRDETVLRVSATTELGHFYAELGGTYPESFELLPRLLLRLAKKHQYPRRP